MEMTDFEIENGILKKYLSTGENVNIPEGVTSIGDGAFWGCTDLTTVTIPKSVKTIGVHNLAQETRDFSHERNAPFLFAY